MRAPVVSAALGVALWSSSPADGASAPIAGVPPALPGTAAGVPRWKRLLQALGEELEELDDLDLELDFIDEKGALEELEGSGDALASVLSTDVEESWDAWIERHAASPAPSKWPKRPLLWELSQADLEENVPLVGSPVDAQDESAIPEGDSLPQGLAAAVFESYDSAEEAASAAGARDGEEAGEDDDFDGAAAPLFDDWNVAEWEGTAAMETDDLPPETREEESLSAGGKLRSSFDSALEEAEVVAEGCAPAGRAFASDNLEAAKGEIPVPVGPASREDAEAPPALEAAADADGDAVYELPSIQEELSDEEYDSEEAVVETVAGFEAELKLPSVQELSSSEELDPEALAAAGVDLGGNAELRSVLSSSEEDEEEELGHDEVDVEGEVEVKELLEVETEFAAGGTPEAEKAQAQQQQQPQQPVEEAQAGVAAAGSTGGVGPLTQPPLSDEDDSALGAAFGAAVDEIALQEHREAGARVAAGAKAASRCSRKSGGALDLVSQIVILNFSASMLRRSCHTFGEYARIARRSAAVMVALWVVLDLWATLGSVARRFGTGYLLSLAQEKEDRRKLGKVRLWSSFLLLLGYALQVVLRDPSPLYVGAGLGLLSHTSEAAVMRSILGRKASGATREAEAEPAPDSVQEVEVEAPVPPTPQPRKKRRRRRSKRKPET